MTSLVARSCLTFAVGAVLATTLACSGADTAPPVATVSFTPSKTRVALGSPIDLTYRFDVATDAALTGDYTVFVHVKNPEGQTLFTDDHAPSVPTSQWQPGQKIEYTRTRFIPVVPYLGTANVEVGLYRSDERLPLQGPDPANRESTSRSYKVAALELLPTTENLFIIYKSGWHPDEFSADDATRSWKWTQKSAVLSVRNPKSDVTLYLEYDARPDLFGAEPQQVTVLAGDQVVTTFAADSDATRLLRIPITAAQLGDGEMAELRLDVSKTFIPAALPAGGRDTRELGIRVYHAFVESR
ncbi:MAG: hypothetical protein IT459_18600 [Planctomycetes bacterium]|nr:hypothetical protein [Planctomycetota bacterium]